MASLRTSCAFDRIRPRMTPLPANSGPPHRPFLTKSARSETAPTYNFGQEKNGLMKITLTNDRPSQLQTDLLVVILNDGARFHDFTGSPLQEVVRQVEQDIKD